MIIIDDVTWLYLQMMDVGACEVLRDLRFNSHDKDSNYPLQVEVGRFVLTI
jgi:hypothetical protein